MITISCDFVMHDPMASRSATLEFTLCLLHAFDLMACPLRLFTNTNFLMSLAEAVLLIFSVHRGGSPIEDGAEEDSSCCGPFQW